MAEAVAESLVRRGVLSGAKVIFSSAGVAAANGSLISPDARSALARKGIEFSGRSRHLVPVMVERAFAVLGMTQHHVEEAQGLVGAGQGGALIERLDPSGDIEDPVGMGAEEYDRVLEHLLHLMPTRLSEILRT